MCELHFKFEEDGQKLRSLLRAIGTSDGQTDRHTLQVILYLSSAIHCIGEIIKVTKYKEPRLTLHRMQQYNLVPAKRVISLARKVTAGLVESNSSLPKVYE